MNGKRLATALAFLFLALLLGGFGWYVRDWYFKLGPEPQTMTAAELVAKGPGENHLVRITDCEFGPVLHEKFPNVSHAWFPVYPRGQPRAKVPPIVYRSAAATSPQELEAQSHPPQVLEVIVCNDVQGMGTAKHPELLRTYPGLDPARVWYVKVDTGPFREVVVGAWIGAPLCAVVGLLCLVLAFRAPPPVDKPAPMEEAASVVRIPAESPPVGVKAAQEGASTGKPVPRYHGTRDNVPPEVAALGSADSIHRPEGFLHFSREHPLVVVGAGGLIVLAGVGLVVSEISKDPTLLLLWLLLVVCGIFVALLPWISKDIPSYLLFRDAIVEVIGDKFTILCFDRMKGLDFPRFIVMDSGEKFLLSTWVQNLGPLYDRAQSTVRARLLPPLVSAMQAGETVTFGDFTLSSTTIGYKGKTLPWLNATSMQLRVSSGTRTLAIWDGGILPWCFAGLGTVPNDWLFLELVRMVCPAYLLVPGRPR